MSKYLTLFLVLTSTQIFAWGDLGHSSVGYIAEKNLSPEGKSFIYSILGGESMGLAAIWPDQVRDDDRYAAFAPYHFLEIPVDTVYGKVPNDRIAAQSADTIISKVPNLLVNRSKVTLLQKQVLLRYLIHVFGDVHQPLHIGNGEDMGANLCEVNYPDAYTGKNKKGNLHSLWDSAMVDYLKKEVEDKAEKPIKYFSYQHLGNALIAEATQSGLLKEVSDLADKTVKADWFEESRALHSEVYPDEKPGTLPSERAYCRVVTREGKVENGKYDSSKVPKLGPEYIEKSLPIIKKRILLAAFRLKNEIERMAKLAKSPAWSPEKEAKFFNGLLVKTEVELRAPSSKKKTGSK